MRSNQFRNILARSLAVLARHAGKAAFAKSIALRVSATPILGTVPINSPVAGLVTGMVALLSASSHWPLM